MTLSQATWLADGGVVAIATFYMLRRMFRTHPRAAVVTIVLIVATVLTFYERQVAFMQSISK
jgi:hypothetical protein